MPGLLAQEDLGLDAWLDGRRRTCGCLATNTGGLDAWSFGSGGLMGAWLLTQEDL